MNLEPSDEELAELEASLQPDTLDDLWADVLSHPLQSKAKQQASAKAKLKEAEEASKAVYSNPNNWKRTRGIALIHQETQTCLGNFAEYIHLQVRDCRKLLREEAPLLVEAVEYVSGNWWLGGMRKPAAPQLWHRRASATLHLYLTELRVHAPAVHVTAFISYGAVERVEIVNNTRFAQWEDGGASGEVLIDLPAGTNIFDILSVQSKLKLREELGL